MNDSRSATHLLQQGRDLGLFQPEGFLETNNVNEDSSISFAGEEKEEEEQEDEEHEEEQEDGSKEEQPEEGQEEYEPNPWDDHSEASESVTTVDSHEEREAAIRDGFLGFLYDKILNDCFQRFLEVVMPWVEWVIDKIRKCLRMKPKEEEQDEVVDVAEEALDGQSTHNASKANNASRASNASRATNATRTTNATGRATHMTRLTSVANLTSSQSSTATTSAAAQPITSANVALQMANSAAQGAATSAATGTSAASTAAAAAAASSSGIVGTITGVVAGAGIASQMGTYRIENVSKLLIFLLATNSFIVPHRYCRWCCSSYSWNYYHRNSLWSQIPFIQRQDYYSHATASCTSRPFS